MVWPWPWRLKVQVAFDNSPLDTAGILWTDITNYVVDDGGIVITRGRTKEGDQFDSGTCDIILNNKEAHWDPSNASGPFFGKLKQRRMIKVDIVHNGIEYRRFTGFIDRFPQEAGSGFNDAYVQAECIDLSGLVALSDLPSAYWPAYARTLDMWAWWRLDEDGTTPPQTLRDATANARHLIADPTLGRPIGGAESLNPNDSQSKALNTGNIDGIGGYRSAHGFHGDLSTGFTVAFWLNVDVTTGADSPSFRQIFMQFGLSGDAAEQNDDNPFNGLQVFVRSSVDEDSVDWSPLCVRVIGSSSHWTSGVDPLVNNEFLTQPESPSGGAGTGQPVGIGQPMYCVIRYEVLSNGMPSCDIKTWIVGDTARTWSYEKNTNGSPGSGDWISPTKVEVDETVLIGHTSYNQSDGAYGMKLDELVFFDRSLSSIETSDLQIASVYPGFLDDVPDRLHRIMDIAEQPLARRDFNHGLDSIFTQIEGMSGKVLSELQRTANSDLGAIYTTLDGRMRFRNRQQISLPPFTNTGLVFGDRPSLGELPYEELIPTLGDDQIVNEARVRNYQGEEYTAKDQSSIDEYMKQTEEFESEDLVLVGIDVRDMAEWIVTRYAHPNPGFESMVIRPMNDSDLISAVLSLDLEMSFHVHRRAPGSAGMLDQKVSMQGYTEEISRTDWVIEYRMTSAHAVGQEFLVLNDPVNGVIGFGRAGY